MHNYLGLVTPAELGSFLFPTTSVTNFANLAECDKISQRVKSKAESGKAETFRIANFCRKNFPEKAHTMCQFSNSQDLQNFMHKHAWKLSRSYRHISRSSRLSLDYLGTFLNYPDTFRMVRKLSRSPRHISRSSGLFLDYLETIPRFSGHCLDRTETFQIIHTLFRLSGHIF